MPSLPGATLVIRLPPALIPFSLILTLPTFTSFAVTEFTLISSFIDTFTPFSSAVVVMFLPSPLTDTLLPSFFTPVVPLSALKVKPFVVTSVCASTPFLISSFVLFERSTV